MSDQIKRGEISRFRFVIQGDTDDIDGDTVFGVSLHRKGLNSADYQFLSSSDADGRFDLTGVPVVLFNLLPADTLLVTGDYGVSLWIISASAPEHVGDVRVEFVNPQYPF